MKSGRVVLAALLGAGLAVIVALVADPRPWLLRSEWGQRALQAALATRAAPGQAVARREEALPQLVLPDLSGRPTHLAAQAGRRPLLVNLWATWCGPCRKEMPVLAGFASRQAPNGVQLVGIAIDAAPDVRAYLQTNPVPYATLVADPEAAPETSARLGNPAGVLPYSLLVDRDGRIVKQHMGAFADARQLQDWARAD